MIHADLSGQTALITGASSGLGAHFARVLARSGAHVALVARSADKLAALADELNGAGLSASVHPADVGDRAALERAFDDAVAVRGRLDIMVNNAGIARTRPFLEMDEDEWRSVLDVDLDGVWRAGQIAARRMQALGNGGSIVNISSILGLAVQPTQANYVAAKGAVIQLTKVMARELWRHGIRVNAIAPGYFKTEINADFFDSPAGEKLISRLMPRRLGRLEELDGPLLLLASEAGSFMTGTTLVVDGGTLLAGT